MTKKANRKAKRIHVKYRGVTSPTMEATQEPEVIPSQPHPEIAAPPDLVKELEEELEQCKAQAAENLDGWQRSRAEFANYKRRIEAERTELVASAGAEALKRVLPAVDDFERALQTLPADLKDHPWINGVALVQRKLNSALEQSGVTPIAVKPGDDFDPNLHEAVTHEDSDQFASEQIIGEVQRGYRLGERVLRPTMVRVAR
jgi:molecular chaperone GrpE